MVNLSEKAAIIQACYKLTTPRYIDHNKLMVNLAIKDPTLIQESHTTSIRRYINHSKSKKKRYKKHYQRAKHTETT